MLKSLLIICCLFILIRCGTSEVINGPNNIVLQGALVDTTYSLVKKENNIIYKSEYNGNWKLNGAMSAYDTVKKCLKFKYFFKNGENFGWQYRYSNCMKLDDLRYYWTLDEYVSYSFDKNQDLRFVKVYNKNKGIDTLIGGLSLQFSIRIMDSLNHLVNIPETIKLDLDTSLVNW